MIKIAHFQIIFEFLALEIDMTVVTANENGVTVKSDPSHHSILVSKDRKFRNDIILQIVQSCTMMGIINAENVFISVQECITTGTVNQ